MENPRQIWWLRSLPRGWLPSRLLAEMLQHLGRDVQHLHDDVRRLRDELLKPRVELTHDKPKDQ